MWMVKKNVPTLYTSPSVRTRRNQLVLRSGHRYYIVVV